jgi:hypothetical protein
LVYGRNFPALRLGAQACLPDYFGESPFSGDSQARMGRAPRLGAGKYDSVIRGDDIRSLPLAALDKLAAHQMNEPAAPLSLARARGIAPSAEPRLTEPINTVSPIKEAISNLAIILMVFLL